jgi:hypothetical protein
MKILKLTYIIAFIIIIQTPLRSILKSTQRRRQPSAAVGVKIEAHSEALHLESMDATPSMAGSSRSSDDVDAGSTSLSAIASPISDVHAENARTVNQSHRVGNVNLANKFEVVAYVNIGFEMC